ncbi:hypothetical protein BDV96DRAFT_640068 [Lophiotrema nucula]|uniref:BTB domain-containing protein n=1 Tax=Lophiotrema nucula TaxID=690887 RepID=A0A6A5ZR95_9PLEO|nr:hypothetical protein BDV96DRAFT_640068 [Lophiotrema nucula]
MANLVRVAASMAMSLGATGVEVLVGEEGKEKKFLVHKDLIASRSQFFATALSGPWKEAEDKVVKLSDDDPQTFELYVQLLYKGHVPILQLKESQSNALAKMPVDFGKRNLSNSERESDDSSRDESSNSDLEDTSDLESESGDCSVGDSNDRDSDDGSDEPEFRELFRLYILCDKLQDVISKNLLIDAVLEATHQDSYKNTTYLPLLEEITILYGGTMAGSPMRRLLVDHMVDHASPKWFSSLEGIMSQVHGDFAVDMMVQMGKRLQRPKSVQPLKAVKYYERIIKKPVSIKDRTSAGTKKENQN